MTDWIDLEARIRAHSPFLARQMDRYPAVVALLAAGDFDAAMAAAQAQGVPEDGVAKSLRRRRGAIALVTAAADLAGAWDMDRVTRTLSDFADQALAEALAATFAERYPDAVPQGFVVLALGKHGSRELNYSSDIDPNKVINWKRMEAVNGAYGCMGDLGMHVLHVPLRLGWRKN